MKKAKLFLLILTALIFIFYLTNIAGATDVLSPDKVVEGVTGIDSNDISPNSVQSSVEAKWLYLKEEWKKILFRNKLISGVDSILKKLNPVFVVLFKESYDLVSFKMWIIIILWFISSSISFDLVRLYGHLKIGWSILASLVISTILAQTYFLTLIYVLLVKLAGYPEYWPVRLILWLVIIVVLFVVYYFEKSWTHFVRLSRKAQKHRLFERKYENFMRIFIDKDSGLGV
ncbi:hypothetical protein AUJ62_03615 [Candidatus Pacearchaeota archaeon CG1_02_32_21]|nr:MAG: hypothetical protein AUJ62_03615 [Candidatus Pacearchaeota archaeon CG1_02_32_21]